jgi:acyl carrier protein
MDDLEGRLTECFALVLPDLTREEIRQASMSSVPAWDSMASVTLVAVIEEEFGVQVALEELEEMVSFDTVLDLLRRRNGATSG